MLISTQPKNEHERAIIARSKQLTDFKWTPVRDIPTFIRSIGNTVMRSGVELTGFPYASEERNDKFITENVSAESFLSAIQNPYSKLYQPGHAAYDVCNYGIVCNGLIRYALGIDERVSTARWGTIPGMYEVKPLGKYSVDELLLCDILYAFCEERKHVALITDILRAEDGEIVEVEVSEAVRPTCRRARYSPEAFYEKYKLFALWRYEYIDSVPLLDTEVDELIWKSGLERQAPKIAVDGGNKSNYLVGDEVVISVFDVGSDTVEILRGGEIVEAIPVLDRAVIPRQFDRGYYTVRLRSAGDTAEFCVNSAKLSYTVKDGIITIDADSCDEGSEILYSDFRQKEKAVGCGFASLEKYERLTQEERATGHIVRPIPQNGKAFKVYFRNRYGIWTHPMTIIAEKP